jgi:hypothetical protein
MNEDRIREIANIASTYAESTVDPFWDLEDGLDYAARMLKVRDLKFTELIIQECVDICDEVQSQYGQYTFTATTVKNRVREHFGVK